MEGSSHYKLSSFLWGPAVAAEADFTLHVKCVATFEVELLGLLHGIKQFKPVIKGLFF